LLKKLRQSLSTRLLLLFAFTSLLIVALLVSTLFNAIGKQWRYGIAPHIEQYLDYVNEDLGYPPDQLRAKELAKKLRINIYIKGPDTDFSTNGRPLDVDDLEFRNRKYEQRRRSDIPRLKNRVVIGEHDDRTVLRNSSADYDVYYELPHRNARSRHKDGLWLPLLLLGSILGGCYLIIRRMLRPVQDIKHAVHAMGAGELGTRVPVRSNNDLGQLSGSINTMASDIEKLLNAKRQLLLGASHELRTPVTRAKLAAQMIDESPHQQSIVDDLNEMESLIADILESERVTGGHSTLNMSEVNLPELVNNVIEELHCEASVTTEFDANFPPVHADATRLRLLLRNLISNALKHGQGEQPPVIRLANNIKNIEISVTDFGPGIAEEHLTKLTEPFYRADPSRTRATGGFGLGLHISELIVQAHGGSLEFVSKPGTGTTVTALLPHRQ
jgi:signal transduction histidine kinase